MRLVLLPNNPLRMNFSNQRGVPGPLVPLPRPGARGLGRGAPPPAHPLSELTWFELTKCSPLSGSLPAGGERERKGRRHSVDNSEDLTPLVPSPRASGERVRERGFHPRKFMGKGTGLVLRTAF